MMKWSSHITQQAASTGDIDWADALSAALFWKIESENVWQSVNVEWESRKICFEFKQLLTPVSLVFVTVD